MAAMRTGKPGAPPCGLYLSVPQDAEPDLFLKSLNAAFRAINASPYEKNFHVLAGYPGMDESFACALAGLARGCGIVFLCAGDIALAMACGADGVILDNADDIAPARKMLGEDRIIVLRCSSSRRMAEHGLKIGADAVSFSNPQASLLNPDIVAWWRLKSDKPSIVESELTPDTAGFYIDAGADLIACGAFVWGHPDGPAKGVNALISAIDAAAPPEQRISA